MFAHGGRHARRTNTQTNRQKHGQTENTRRIAQNKGDYLSREISTRTVQARHWIDHMTLQFDFNTQATKLAQFE